MDGLKLGLQQTEMKHNRIIATMGGLMNTTSQTCVFFLLLEKFVARISMHLVFSITQHWPCSPLYMEQGIVQDFQSALLF